MLWRGAGQYNAYSVLLLLLLLLREPVCTPLGEMLPPWEMRGPVSYEVPGGWRVGQVREQVEMSAQRREEK